MSDGRDGRTSPERVRFGPQPIALFPLLIAFLGALPLATSSRYLLWLLLLPVAGAWWVLRARVVVGAVGVAVGNGLRTTYVAWPDVEGFDVPQRGWVRLLHAGDRTPLTALSRRDLPALLAVASRLGSTDGAASRSARGRRP